MREAIGARQNGPTYERVLASASCAFRLVPRAFRLLAAVIPASVAHQEGLALAVDAGLDDLADEDVVVAVLGDVDDATLPVGGRLVEDRGPSCPIAEGEWAELVALRRHGHEERL